MNPNTHLAVNLALPPERSIENILVYSPTYSCAVRDAHSSLNFSRTLAFIFEYNGWVQG